MTKGERADPSIINESRARRIAKGSGRGLEEVHGLIQRFDGMRKMMSQIGSNPGLLGRIPGMKQLGQLKALKGMGMGDLMGEMAGMGGGMPGVSKRQSNGKNLATKGHCRGESQVTAKVNVVGVGVSVVNPMNGTPRRVADVGHKYP